MSYAELDPPVPIADLPRLYRSLGANGSVLLHYDPARRNLAAIHFNPATLPTLLTLPNGWNTTTYVIQPESDPIP